MLEHLILIFLLPIVLNPTLFLLIGGVKSFSEPINKIRFSILVVFCFILTCLPTLYAFLIIGSPILFDISNFGICLLLILVCYCVLWFRAWQDYLNVDRFTVYVAFQKIFFAVYLVNLLIYLPCGGVLERKKPVFLGSASDTYGLEYTISAYGHVWSLSSIIVSSIILFFLKNKRSQKLLSSKRTMIAAVPFATTYVLVSLWYIPIGSLYSLVYPEDIYPLGVFLSAIAVFFLTYGFLKEQFKLRWVCGLLVVCFFVFYGFQAQRLNAMTKDLKTAQDPEASIDQLKELLNSLALREHEDEVLMRLVENPKSDADVLRRIYRINSHRYDFLLAAHLNTPADVFRELSKKADYEMKQTFFNNSSYLKFLVKKGDKFVVQKSFDAIGLTGWKKENEFACVLSQGLLLRAKYDQEDINKEILLIPDNYEELEVTWVPQNLRQLSDYRGYFLKFDHKDIGTLIERMSCKGCLDDEPMDFVVPSFTDKCENLGYFEIGEEIQKCKDSFRYTHKLYKFSIELPLSWSKISGKSRKFAQWGKKLYIGFLPPEENVQFQIHIEESRSKDIMEEFYKRLEQIKALEGYKREEIQQSVKINDLTFIKFKFSSSVSPSTETYITLKDGFGYMLHFLSNDIASFRDYSNDFHRIINTLRIDSVAFRYNGIYTEYYDNGKLMMEINYKNGKKDGIAKTYYNTGGVFAEWSYKENKREGFAKLYYEDGHLNQETYYKQDQHDGISRSYYPDGVLEMETTFKEGKLHGITKAYYQSGKLKTEMILKEDLIESAREFDEDGNVISEEYTTKDPEEIQKGIAGFQRASNMLEEQYTTKDLEKIQKGIDEAIEVFRKESNLK